ncbi:methyltransferase domain-containing protein [Novosphingobium sp. TH158]|uniref:methyltransferase domain-containing protein n=1 Tax=Novosphingobium sp. TH158 TaxID=2067455 RepID=UPI000C7B525D|nr:methyltransferase domain-containing protein [Novosphingobium sp. TH158]PLK25987.1 hypothetical protein C0V78_03080 [Novosphingobium sp. TH158]
MTHEQHVAAFEALLDAWLQSARDNDLAATGQLLADDYRMELPDGSIATWQAEQAFRQQMTALEVLQRDAVVAPDGRTAQASLLIEFAQGPASSEARGRFKLAVSALNTDGGWKVQHIRCAIDGRAAPPPPPAPSEPSRLARLKQRLRRAFPTAEREVAQGHASHLPYRPGESFILPPRPERRPEDDLPIPPEHLWLGYNYPMHGKLHVGTMLDALRETGFSIGQGHRVIDLGCGAGRMIRHLLPYASTAEIWGLDISAEHIFWCRENLSPPFRFATTTKVPTLPFKDSSVALVYCGSLFTHIDDLADAWLCELRRVLKPDGRLFLTIHDQHTMNLLGQPEYGWTPLARLLREHPLYEEAQGGFGMLSIGRDDLSQVFYDRSYFEAMTDQSFETLSVIEEAYFYQTAMVLKPL